MNLCELNKDELLDLLIQYNKYIQEANDDNAYHTGWRPVCISEFYMCEYQIILEEKTCQ